MDESNNDESNIIPQHNENTDLISLNMNVGNISENTTNVDQASMTIPMTTPIIQNIPPVEQVVHTSNRASVCL